jgi:hypothetical protein
LRGLGAAAGGVDDVAISMAARRIGQKATNNPPLFGALKKSREKLELLNV